MIVRDGLRSAIESATAVLAEAGIDSARHDAEALAVAQRLVKDAGFEPVVVGPLSRAREFDVGTPVYTRLMTAPQLRQALGLK